MRASPKCPQTSPSLPEPRPPERKKPRGRARCRWRRRRPDAHTGGCVRRTRAGGGPETPWRVNRRRARESRGSPCVAPRAARPAVPGLPAGDRNGVRCRPRGGRSDSTSRGGPTSWIAPRAREVADTRRTARCPGGDTRREERRLVLQVTHRVRPDGRGRRRRAAPREDRSSSPQGG